MGSERLTVFCTRIGFERLSVFFTRIVSEKAVDGTVSDFLPGGGEETFHDNDDTGRNDDWKNNDTKNDEQKEKVETFRDRKDVELSVIEEAASLFLRTRLAIIRTMSVLENSDTDYTNNNNGSHQGIRINIAALVRPDQKDEEWVTLSTLILIV
jgi:hypothetical protein